MKTPKTSVVVPALNEEHYVGRLLSDLALQTRKPDEVLLVDAGSTDGTLSVVARSGGVEVLRGSPPVAKGRNLGGASASGDVIFFVDADVRLPARFLERFVEEFERRRLDVACPVYLPYESTAQVRAIHAFFNAQLKAFQRVLPSGAGHCIAVRASVFRESGGFDEGLKFDDVEFVRRASRGRRFAIIDQKVFVSDRRYREYGATRMFFRYLLMSLFFALGRFRWANLVEYEFGRHRPAG